MKKIILLLILTLGLNGFAQETNNQKEAVKLIINQFFKSLEAQDTVLFKKVSIMKGQIWTINSTKQPTKSYSRFFKDDINSFDPKTKLEEIPKSFDIKIHKDIAMAWVPYEFKVNGKFSHCGIDVFTLIKENDNWKIANVSYTLEKEGCEELQ